MICTGGVCSIAGMTGSVELATESNGEESPVRLAGDCSPWMSTDGKT
jgi:hypothetical protein